MNRSAPSRASDHSQAKARRAWGDDAPEWIAVLAKACDEAGSQNRVAKRLGKSAAMISRALDGTYEGSYAALEQAVRDTLMDREVRCPGLTRYIPVRTCLDWQAKPFAATNALRVQMYRACRGGCPHYRGKENDDASK